MVLCLTQHSSLDPISGSGFPGFLGSVLLPISTSVDVLVPVGATVDAVVRAVDRAVDCVAVLKGGTMDCVMASVTIVRVAVDRDVATIAGAEVSHVLLEEVVRGISAWT